MKRLLLVLTLFSYTVAGVAADSGSNELEYRVKAALLYKIVQFVQWPEHEIQTSQENFGICVLGANPFGQALASLRGQKVALQPIELIVASEHEDLPERCKLVFVSASEQARLANTLDSFSGSPVLLISDMPQFAQAGGMIAMALTPEGKIRFEVNLAAVTRSGLVINPQLLQLSTIVAVRE